MQRRTLLRLAGVAAGGVGAGAAGLHVATAEASGQTGLTLSVSGDDATIASDGSVTAVTLDIDVDWQYDLPDSTAPETVVVEVAAGTDELVVVGSAESAQLFTEADGSESFEVGLIDGGALAASDLEPDGSGTHDTEVTVEARLRVESSGDSVLAKESTSDTALLTVTREGVEASAYGEVGGSGSLSISTE
jgi:hypothetical protein